MPGKPGKNAGHRIGRRRQFLPNRDLPRIRVIGDEISKCSADIDTEHAACAIQRRSCFKERLLIGGSRGWCFYDLVLNILARRFTDVSGSGSLSALRQVADTQIGVPPRGRRPIQRLGRRDTQSATASPLLISLCTSPLIMKLGDTWMPFWREYRECHLISRSKSGMANASASRMPP